MLVIDTENVYVFVGKLILFQIDAVNLDEAAVAFLASFYLLDFDYPKQFEVGLNMLQYFVFKDEHTPKDIAVTFNGLLSSYKKYKNEAV